MSFPVLQVFQAVESHAAASGRFEQVNMHEPKNAPGHGITCAIWVQHLGTILSSGLASSSAVLRLSVRIYQNFISQPEDAIDPNVTEATAVLFDAYAGDFTLGNLIRQVDLHGTAGVPLSAEAGYIPQDKLMYRCMTITLPLLINDAFNQEA